MAEGIPAHFNGAEAAVGLRAAGLQLTDMIFAMGRKCVGVAYDTRGLSIAMHGDRVCDTRDAFEQFPTSYGTMLPDGKYYEQSIRYDYVSHDIGPSMVGIVPDTLELVATHTEQFDELQLAVVSIQAPNNILIRGIPITPDTLTQAMAREVDNVQRQGLGTATHPLWPRAWLIALNEEVTLHFDPYPSSADRQL